MRKSQPKTQCTCTNFKNYNSYSEEKNTRTYAILMSLPLHCKFLILIMRKKKLKRGKNLLVLSKSLLVTIART